MIEELLSRRKGSGLEENGVTKLRSSSLAFPAQS